MRTILGLKKSAVGVRYRHHVTYTCLVTIRYSTDLGAEQMFRGWHADLRIPLSRLQPRVQFLFLDDDRRAPASLPTMRESGAEAPDVGVRFRARGQEPSCGNS